MNVCSLRAYAAALAFGLLTHGLAADDGKPNIPVQVDLKVGDSAPGIDTRTDADATWSSADRFGKKWVVVYFYPGDVTPGCIKQAQAFRDAMHKLEEKGVEVVGISGDSVQTHAMFKVAQKLNFTLLADEDGAIAKRFGVPVGPAGKVKTKDAVGNPVEIARAATFARWTFVIGKDGRVAYKNTKVLPADDAKKITEFVNKAEEK